MGNSRSSGVGSRDKKRSRRLSGLDALALSRHRFGSGGPSPEISANCIAGIDPVGLLKIPFALAEQAVAPGEDRNYRRGRGLSADCRAFHLALLPGAKQSPKQLAGRG